MYLEQNISISTHNYADKKMNPFGKTNSLLKGPYSKCIIYGMEIVYRSHGELQAQVIKSLLDSFGIPSYIQSQVPASVYAVTADGIGEYRVMVNKELADEAKKIIEAKSP